MKNKVSLRKRVIKTATGYRFPDGSGVEYQQVEWTFPSGTKMTGQKVMAWNKEGFSDWPMVYPGALDRGFCIWDHPEKFSKQVKRYAYKLLTGRFPKVQP